MEHPDLVRQECAEWCWAAAASMIFGSLGHQVDQKRIVDAVYHGRLCAAVQNTAIVSQVLNSVWTDDDGEQFRPQIEAGYDQEHGVFAINNAIIINELSQNRALLYANTHHCMVIVEADYIQTPFGPKIINVGVLDPWPSNLPPYQSSFHSLTPPELHPAYLGGQMMYLAAVRI